MKIALCLSGQPRSWRTGFEYHRKNIINRYNTDIFLHTWDYIPEKMLNNLVETYQPKYVSTETPTDEFVNSEISKYTRIPNQQFPAENTYLMFYSIKKSLEIPVSTTDYDVVIRSRYDYALNVSFKYEQVCVNKIYVPADRQTPERDFCADMFAFGTPTVMKAYAETFDNLQRAYDDGTTFIGEDLLSWQLKQNGLVGNNMIYENMNNPFPPGKYNGNKHSIIRDDFTDWNKLRG